MSSNSRGWFVPRRSLEELLAERSYLLSSLRQENSKATELLRKLPPWEKTLLRSKVSRVCRKARKQIGWLRYRINETIRQENTILNRLGELAHEIQFRERWDQIEDERRRHGQVSHSQMGLCQEMQQISLTPATPEFQYIEFPPPSMEMPLQQNHIECPRQRSAYDRASALSYPGYDQEVNPGINDSFKLDISTKRDQKMALCRPTLMQRSSSMSKLDGNLMPTELSNVSVSQTKRHSTGEPGVSKTRSDYIDEEEESSCTEEESSCAEESSEQPRYTSFYTM